MSQNPENKIQSSEKTNKTINYLNFIISFVAVCTPAAYLIGTYFYKGHLAGFGISVEAFPIATTTVYVYAYLAVSLFGLDIFELIREFFQQLGYLSAFAIVASSLGAVFLMIKMEKNKDSIKSISTWKVFSKLVRFFHWKNNDFTKALGVTGLATYGIIGLIYLIFAVILLWLFMPTYAYKKGKSFSIEQIKEYSTNGCFTEKDEGWMNCVCVIDEEGKKKEGLLFAIDSTNIGLFNEAGTHIVRINQKMEILRGYKSQM